MNILNFVKNEMRVSVKEKGGEYVFYLKDVASALGFVNTRDGAIRSDRVKGYVLEAYEKCSITLPPEVVELDPNTFVREGHIHESVLYLLMMKAKSEKAIQFQVWMAQEVLPSLRKNNYYINEDHISEEQYSKLIAQVKELTQQNENFSNILVNNTRKSQSLKTYLEQMFPSIKDVYMQFLNNMQKAGMLDENYYPTVVFMQHNEKKNMFKYHQTIGCSKLESFSLTNKGMEELAKRLFIEDTTLKIKSEDPATVDNKDLVLF